MNSWLKAGYEGFDTAGEVIQFYQQRDDDPADSDEAHADYNNDGLGEEIIAHRRCLRGEDTRHIRNADQRGMPVRSARRQLRESDPYQAFYMYSSDSDSGSEDFGGDNHPHRGGGRTLSNTAAASSHSSKIVRQLREQRRVSERSKHTQWASMCPMPVGLASERLHLTRALHLPATTLSATRSSHNNTSSTPTTTNASSQHLYHSTSHPVPSGMGIPHGSATTMVFEAPSPSPSTPAAAVRSPLLATPLPPNTTTHTITTDTTNPSSSSTLSFFASASFSQSGRAAMVAVPQTSANHPSNKPLGGLAGHTATHVHLECAVPTGECDLLHTNTSKSDLAVLFGGVELEGLQKVHRDLQALDSREYGSNGGAGNLMDAMGVKRGRGNTNPSSKRLEKARIDAFAASSLVNGDFSVLELGVPESRQLFTQQKMRLATRTATTSITSFQGATLKGRFGHCTVPFSFSEVPTNYSKAATAGPRAEVKAEVEESFAVKEEPQNSNAYGTREDTVGVATTAVSVAETVPVEDVDEMAYTNDLLEGSIRDKTVEVKSEPTSAAPFLPLRNHHHLHTQLPTSRHFHLLPDNCSNSNSATTVLNGEGGGSVGPRTRSPSLHGHHLHPEGDDGVDNNAGERTVVRISPRQMPPSWASPPQPLKTKSSLLIIGGCTSVDMVHARRVRRLYGNSIGTFRSDFDAWSGEGTSKSTPTQLNLMQYVKRSSVVFEPWLCSVEAHRIPHGRSDAILPRKGVASSSQIETRVVCQPFTSVINAPSGRCFATCVELPSLPICSPNDAVDLTTPPFSRFLLFGGTADGLFPVGWDAEKAAIGQQARSDRRSRRIRARRMRQELADKAMRGQKDDEEGSSQYRRGGNSSSAFAESDNSSMSSGGDSEDEERRVRHNNRRYQHSEDEAHTSNPSVEDCEDGGHQYRAQRRSGRVESTPIPLANDDDTPLISLPNESNSDACVLLMVDPTERVMLCDGDIVRREHQRLQHHHHQASSSISPSSSSRMKGGRGAAALHQPPAQLRLLRPNQSFITGGPCPRFGHSCTSLPTNPGLLLLYGGVGGRPSSVDDRLRSGRSTGRREHMRLLGRGKESRLPSLLCDLWEFSSITYCWREISLWHASPAPTSLPLRAFHVCVVVVDPSLLPTTASMSTGGDVIGGGDAPAPFLFLTGGKLQNNHHDRAVRGSSSSASGSGRSGLVPTSTATDDPMTSIFATVAAASIIVDLTTGAWRPVSTPAFNDRNALSKAGQGDATTGGKGRDVVVSPSLSKDHLRDTISLTLSRFYSSLHLPHLADIQQRLNLSGVSGGDDIRSNRPAITLATTAGRRVQFFEEDDTVHATAGAATLSGMGYRRVHPTPPVHAAVSTAEPTLSSSSSSSSLPADNAMPSRVSTSLVAEGEEGDSSNDFCLPSSSSDVDAAEVQHSPTDPPIEAPRSESPDTDLDLLSCLLDTDVAEDTKRNTKIITPTSLQQQYHHNSAPVNLQAMLSLFASEASSSVAVEKEAYAAMQPTTAPQAKHDTANVVPPPPTALPLQGPRATALGALLTLSGCPFTHAAHGAYSAGLVVALPPPNTPSDFWCGRRVPHVVLFGGEGAVNIPQISEFVFPQLAASKASSGPRDPATTTTLSIPSLTLKSSAALFLAQSSLPLASAMDGHICSSRPLSEAHTMWAPQERDLPDSVARYESGTTRFAVAKSVVKEPPQFSLPL